MNAIRSLMTAGIALLAFGILAPVSIAAQQTRADAEKDPVLKAMLAEMDRSMSQLQLPGFAKPFFIQYRIEEVDNFETKAEFGASEGSERRLQRVTRVIVRVGDYKTDNSGVRADGAVALAALDGDEVALRSALWAATDQAYKAALADYAQKQASLKQIETPPQADDFSQEKPVIALQGTARLDLDEKAWADRMARASGLYRTADAVMALEPHVESSAALFHAQVKTTWLVTSEGAIVRKAAAEYQESFAVSAQAADGMRLDRSYGSQGASLKDLDSEDAFAKHAVEEIASLGDLRAAPVVEEEFHGPVLLSSSASAAVLTDLLAGAVPATRPKLGTQARTNGPFASSYHARVLPDWMNVVDDPGLKSYEGKGLVGAYEIDDEAVPAQAVKLVESGRLKNYLVGRTPVKDFTQSNGHGRAGLTAAPRASLGVMQVTAQNGVTDDELMRQLIQMGKERGLSSVYYVKKLGSGLAPALLYRVSVDGVSPGKLELVRGAVLDEVDQRALRSSIVAAGKEQWAANYYGDIPTSVLAPALLFDDAAVKRANEKNDRLPFYPPPE
jgi:TldD protein